MRKPSLSPSRISTYLACPVKYKWTYVDGRGKWLIRSKSYYSFGSSLHHVLQRFHDAEDTGVTTVHEALAAAEEGWIDAGYGSQAEMMEALAEGKDIIQNYIDDIARQPTTKQTLFVEKTLRKDFGTFVLLGRIDRLDEHDDGTLDVVDYKSGRAGVTEEEVKGDLAMQIYQLLVREKNPGRTVQATIYALRTGVHASASLSDEEVTQLEADLQLLADEILNRDYESLTPVYKSICPQCDFRSLCQKDPEFAASFEGQSGVSSAGRTPADA
ncbi:MAG: PD-(D/E)XK nuclease family protein [Fimbriimonadaceae bacterium]|nr:PD-(D/E)XK nuclease family protein [Fimbriimonadaceae bacterium]